jgi:hypothetical protein
MKITFDYNREKDVWCLLNKGKGSINSSTPTEVYKKLIDSSGENPSTEITSKFIDEYLTENEYKIQDFISEYENNFNTISKDYKKIALTVFNISLDHNITAYLTINSRCPYNIEENWFFVSIAKKSSNLTIMHELWHFYTWYKFGTKWEEKLGKEKYNDIKESLTVLLNVECKDLLSEGKEDIGYPQHKEMREEILKIWGEEKDIEKLWNKII